jgi:hypothetical protein
VCVLVCLPRYEVGARCCRRRLLGGSALVGQSAQSMTSGVESSGDAVRNLAASSTFHIALTRLSYGP